MFSRIGIEDFCRLFNTVEMCSVNPDSMSGEASDDTTTPSWTLSSHQGTWVPMCSAGGSRKYPSKCTFITNKSISVDLNPLGGLSELPKGLEMT